MTTIIKSENQDQLAIVRRVSNAGQSVQQESVPDLAALELEALRKELALRDDAIAKLRDDVEEAHRRGQKEGFAQGRLEAETREQERLQLLEQASAKALEDLKLSLASTERIAALLTHQCLDKLFGETLSYGEIVHGLVRAQLDRLEQHAVVSIEVSSADFPDEEALQTLATRIGLGATLIKAREDRVSGSCVMQLRLGQLDLGLDRQWGGLRDLLLDIAENAPEPGV